jgi:hypothetical protein
MSALITPASQPLADVEIEEFRVLGITLGHWVALAPAPLFQNAFNTPHPGDLQTLTKIQLPLKVEGFRQLDSDRIFEGESLWKKLCQKTFSAEWTEIANALLAWFLAKRLKHHERENYLNVLDTIAARYSKTMRPFASNSGPSNAIRQRLERYLPHTSYTRHPGDPKITPPDAVQVAEVFGGDLWKQMLVTPIVAALAEAEISASAAASVADVLAHVTFPHPYNKPYPLEPYLASGSWRRLFEGLLNPLRREVTEPLVLAGMDIAARGLASLAFVERESLLHTIHEQIERGIDRSDQKKVTADEWIDRMRIKVEEVIAQATPVVASPPTPSQVTSSAPPSASVARQNKGTGSSASHLTTAVPQDALSVKIPVPSHPPPVSQVSQPIPSRPAVVVERAKPFSTVTWEQALSRAGKVTVNEIRMWIENPQRPPMLFDDCRTECPEVAIVRDPKHVPSTLWVIGDLHADLLTLANIITYADQSTTEGDPPAFVFLGDFVDRGRHDHETLLLLFQLILKNPGRVCIIPGNHDIDLQWDEKAAGFRVSIEPAEYCERLSSLLRSNGPGVSEQVEFAKLLINFWQGRPKAAILPDGTLLAHGGFPHTDMQGALRTPADLARPYCLSDFLWARIAETSRKRPNRGNRGHEFGWETFAQFCKVTAQIGVPPVKRFIRGHDHVAARWQSYPDYSEFPVITINAMGRRMDGEPDPVDGPHPFPVMARYVPDQMPTVVQLPLDPNEVNRAFGKDTPKALSQSNMAASPDESPCTGNSQKTEGSPLPAHGHASD